MTHKVGYTILLILGILPIGLYALFTLKFNANHQLKTYYIIEVIIVLILTSIAQFHFYKTYHLNLLPSQDQINMAFGFTFIFSLILFIVGFFRKKFTKKDGFSLKDSAILFLSLLFFFIWIIPLGQKYDYTKRLDTMEDVFENGNLENVQATDDVMIAFVYSGHDRFIRPRYRKPAAYSNFFYIRNVSDSSYKGQIYLTLYGEDGETVDLKHIDNIMVEPGSTELLVIADDNPLLDNEWDMRSFKTKKEVHGFEAKIIFD